MNIENELIRRRKRIIDAWRTLAPTATLNGKTLDQWIESTNGAEEVRQRFDEIQATILAMRQERLQADAIVRDEIAALVDSLKGNPEYGANSPLYGAFGYVPRDARKSGLTRKGKDSTNTNTTDNTDAA